MNVLKQYRQATVFTLLAAGKSQREIERITNIDRKTIRVYQRRFDAEQANSPTPATGSKQGIDVGLRALPRLH